MASEIPGTFGNAFCGQSDIEDVTLQKYGADARPGGSTLNRTAELAANDLVIDLTTGGHGAITPATVTANSVEAKALRRINALVAGARLIASTPERQRAASTPEPGDLRKEAADRLKALLSYLDTQTGTTLVPSSHWSNPSDTVPFDDPGAGEAEDHIRTEFVTTRTRF